MRRFTSSCRVATSEKLDWSRKACPWVKDGQGDHLVKETSKPCRGMSFASHPAKNGWSAPEAHEFGPAISHLTSGCARLGFPRRQRPSPVLAGPRWMGHPSSESPGSQNTGPAPMQTVVCLNKAISNQYVWDCLGLCSFFGVKLGGLPILMHTLVSSGLPG